MICAPFGARHDVKENPRLGAGFLFLGLSDASLSSALMKTSLLIN